MVFVSNPVSHLLHSFSHPELAMPKSRTGGGVETIQLALHTTANSKDSLLPHDPH